MNQLTKNASPESKLLFGHDLNKRISQIKNINFALVKPVFNRTYQNDRYNESQVP